jgi:FAD/FMN-containing dehydrogenase/Fe-S oxidoreductase
MGRPTLSLAESQALAAVLRRELRGEVRFDAGSRALYAADASNYRQVPIGVVFPADADDVEAAVAACRRFGAPVLGRGAGTSLAGQACNVAVVLDMSSHMDRILQVDPDRRLARVQPGVVIDRLRDAAEVHHLTFGPDPATHSQCTVGGSVGNNSCGVHALMNGKTVDNVTELEVLTYDGVRLRVGPTGGAELAEVRRRGGRPAAIYQGLADLRDRHAEEIRARYPDIPRRVSGFNLDELLPERGFHVARALVGTESTCALVLEATCQLIDSPPSRALLVLGYPDVYLAADAVPAVLEHRPTGLEAIDDRLVADLRSVGLHPRELDLLPEGAGWLLVELGAAERGEAVALARRLQAALGAGQPGGPSARLFEDPAAQARIWLVRESALGATARVPGRAPNHEGWEDSAVAPELAGAYLRDLRKLLDGYGYGGAFYGHLGQGCMHTRNDFDLTSHQGVARFRAYMEEAADLVVAYGGSLSGEHGDGQARAELLPKMFGEELVGAFAGFKALFDPDGRMNPGKVVDPDRLDQHLRLAGWRPAPQRTHFAYAEEGGWANAMLRCVGVGKCRQTETGIMCPSWMVTREEAHSTRGRAHLLFELLQGDPLRDGWRERPVKDALDLCLACKGCKRDCPTSVDMATYKAEFLAHHYKGRLRPRTAYTVGLVHWSARLAALAPRLVNGVAGAPLLGSLAKRLAGVAPERELPAVAAQTFTRWFGRRDVATASRSAGRGGTPGRGPGPQGRRPVLLFPDTFTDHFHPAAGRAAVRVLEAAGFAVQVPERPLCCGRPLYDFGMLDLAKRQLRRILRTLGPAVDAGVPVVVLEPSCLATFRDELPNLLPGEPARRLAGRALSLAELLAGAGDGWRPPAVGGRAIVQGHCHQQAVIGMDPDLELLAAAGVDAELLDAGCCGMAGAFGFEADHYRVAMAVGERRLLPAVRAAAPDTVVLADGFSCRTQVEQATGRRPLHLAELLARALPGG